MSVSQFETDQGVGVGDYVHANGIRALYLRADS